MSIWLGNKKLAGDIVKYSHNIGDIFYTSRTDTTLAGAVECNGATYQTTDYTGTGSIGELLSAGKLPYISLSQYASDLAAHGSVRAFGWDGGSSTAFRVPTLQNVFLEAGQAASAGEYISAGLPNITGMLNNTMWQSGSSLTGAFGQVGINRTDLGVGSAIPSGAWHIDFNASRSSAIYGNSTTVQPNSVKYRAMVQLFNGATDEAVATCTSVLADVADLKDLSNITADGKEVIAHNAMPSDTFVELTLGASGATYTAPADGWFISRQQYDSGYYQVTLADRSIAETNTSNTQMTFMIPVRKGQFFGYTYSNLVTTGFGYFGFLYANGAQ